MAVVACSASVASRPAPFCLVLKTSPKVGQVRLLPRQLLGTGSAVASLVATRAPRALFGGGGESGQPQDKKKFISKDQEPEQYWQTADEKDGKGPMSTALPYIALLGLLTPFLILGIAFTNNWIKLPIR